SCDEFASVTLSVVHTDAAATDPPAKTVTRYNNSANRHQTLAPTSITRRIRLPQAGAVLPGRHIHALPECSGEIGGAAEADFGGDVANTHVGIRQPFPAHAQAFFAHPGKHRHAQVLAK